MIFYLLAIVFFGLLTIVAFGLTIGGLVKKSRKLWVSSLCGFLFFTLLTVFLAFSYVKKSVDYIGSEEFQNETKKKAENLGKTWGNTVSGTAQGLEETLDEGALEKLAGKGSRIIGKGIKAAAIGLDETVGKTIVFTDESIDKAGITVGRADQILESNVGRSDSANDPSKYSFGLFLEFKNDFDGKLILTAFDSRGAKIDIAKVSIKETAGKEKVYVFKFDYFKPSVSNYCVLSRDK